MKADSYYNVWEGIATREAKEPPAFILASRLRVIGRLLESNDIGRRDDVEQPACEKAGFALREVL
jgi:hypothetical protein